MSLLPASGFQSAQYRLIELSSTDLYYLVNPESRDDFDEHDIPEQVIEKVYWRSGATELATGIKTLTLRQFEEKYMDTFIKRIKAAANKNLRQLYVRNFTESTRHDEIRDVLRRYDALVNVFWPLAHYKSAVRYLQKDPEDIAATGGTNWQKYLPPRFQKIIFFPELWSEEEQRDWGKGWVMKALEVK